MYFLIDFTSLKRCFPGNINNNNLQLTGTSGSLPFPSFPVVPNVTSLSCEWLITAPVQGQIVSLNFQIFEMYASSPCKDYVEVLDGRYNYSMSKGRFCGNSRLASIFSSGRYMRVHFRWNYQVDVKADPSIVAEFRSMYKSSGK